MSVATSAPPRMAPEQPRIRPRNFHLSDLGIIAGAAASSLSLVWLVFERLTLLSGSGGFLVCWLLGFLTIYWLVVREVEDRVAAVDKLWTVVITIGALFLIIPLVSIVVFIIAKGIKAFTFTFFVQTQQFVAPTSGAKAGGALHSIVGTLEQVGIAILISVPLALATAVFLNEIGGKGRRLVRMLVDAMSGVPSIVAGLFIYAVVIIGLGWGFSGFAASLALSILMLPTVTRTSEEVLRLVPGGLREAGLALGSQEWRVTWSVVLPTARSGLITAVILGVARAIGETAPLLFTAFGNTVMNANAFHGAQDSLSLFAYTLIRFPQVAEQQRAWTGAMVLMFIVLVLFVVARIVGRQGGVARKALRAAAVPTPYEPTEDTEIE
jgi:phosphate transport system permease protein